MFIESGSLRSKNKDKIPINGPKAKIVNPKDQLTMCIKTGISCMEKRLIPKPREV